MKDGGVSSLFPTAFFPGTRILEIGSGSGRDMSLLLKRGYDAWGIDASGGMIEQSMMDFPELVGRCEQGTLPSETLFFNGNFDGILCSAVLQHLENDRLFDAAFTLKRNLKKNGRLLLSVPLERDDLNEEARDPQGRLHIIRHHEEYTLLFERLGFNRIGQRETPDGLGRKGIRWISMIFELPDAGAVRSIDMIESVINRDRKTATYKLALFRALAEISSQEYNSVKRYPDGRVGVPLSRIAEKWLLYYWPIFANETFIPQINGEGLGCSKPVAFRAPVMELVRHYGTGGIGSFISDIYRGTLNTGTSKIYTEALKIIKNTVVKGPVQYAGGSLDNTLFEYHTADKTVLVDPGIWKELSLMWHWIGDALVLRWGELTESMSQGAVKSSEVIDLLIQRPDEERDMALSRKIFLKQDCLECVWSGKPVTNNFAVDHVIPFSLWRNNDLWNLLPSHPVVNNRKSDKLPSRELIRKRRDVMVDYWRLIFESSGEWFLPEVQRVAGIHGNGNWEAPLFNAVVEAVEFTALQRGVERWGG